MNFGTVMSRGNNAEWRFVYQGDNAPNNRVEFGFNDYVPPVLSYLVNGRVGIGEGNPSAKLHVMGTGKFADTLFGTRAQFTSLTSGANTDSIVTVDGSGNLKRRTLTNIVSEPWYKVGTTSGATNNTDSIYIKGSVGIGTATPQSTLHAQSALLATKTVNADANLLTLSRPTTSGVKWDNIAQFNLGSYSATTANATSRLDLGLNDGGTTATTNVMTWQANGNVGIGTTAPTKALDVNGELRIRTVTAGSIYTDSLLVADATGVVKKAKYITPGVNNLDGAFSAYTIALSDMGGIIIVNSSIDVTITVPTTLPAGFTTQIIQKGTGKVTMINAVGLTLSSANGYKTRVQFSAIGLVMASSTEGYITGDSSNL